MHIGIGNLHKKTTRYFAFHHSVTDCNLNEYVVKINKTFFVQKFDNLFQIQI